MGSHSSNVDSDGIPVDQDGFNVEFGLMGSQVPPFAVAGSVFQELFSGSLTDVGLPSHLESDMLGGDKVVVSSSNGIPIQALNDNDVLVEDDSVSEGEDDLSGPGLDPTSQAVRAVFSITKNEREALIEARHKILELKRFMKSKGLSMAEFDKEKITSEGRFNSGIANPLKFIQGRDEFGLPIFSVNTSTVGAKGPSGVVPPHTSGEALRGAPKGILKKPTIKGETSGLKDGLGKETPSSAEVETNTTKSWSNVLKAPPPSSSDVVFDYVPLPNGVSVVSPPVEVLRKGVEKFKCCVIGKLTKAPLPFLLVKKTAFAIWEKKGLALVSQKDDSTFVFKFNSVQEKNDVLSRGTWYIKNRPLVLTNWGGNVGVKQMDSIPLWVKFSNLPDCYWTKEGLSSIASVVGVPLGADVLTSQLEILPFAKMCVKYKLGDPLPSSIPVMDMDPVTEVKSEVSVRVSYFNKPLFCSHCSSLGHKINACPTAKRIWVQKSVIAPKVTSDPPVATPVVNSVPPVVISVPRAGDPHVAPNLVSEVRSADSSSGVGNSDPSPWIEVKSKRKALSSPGSSMDSPSPIGFKNVLVDEIDQKIGTKVSRASKQKKKVLGSPPPLP